MFPVKYFMKTKYIFEQTIQPDFLFVCLSIVNRTYAIIASLLSNLTSFMISGAALPIAL